MTDRRFPPPWSIEDIGACLSFVIGCTHVKALCRLLCDSFDARAIRGRLSWFSSSDKFNLFGGPVVSCGAAARPTLRSCWSHSARSVLDAVVATTRGHSFLQAFPRFGGRGELPVLSFQLSDKFQPTRGYHQIIPAQLGVGLCCRLPHTLFGMAKAFANSITQHRTSP
jgi:hypothetical protein